MGTERLPAHQSASGSRQSKSQGAGLPAVNPVLKRVNPNLTGARQRQALQTTLQTALGTAAKTVCVMLVCLILLTKGSAPRGGDDPSTRITSSTPLTTITSSKRSVSANKPLLADAGSPGRQLVLLLAFHERRHLSRCRSGVLPHGMGLGSGDARRFEENTDEWRQPKTSRRERLSSTEMKA
jgi:hypothetical protein